jgi:hypothetical protein
VAEVPPLPAGFTLDQEAPPLPPGFTLDEPQAAQAAPAQSAAPDKPSLLKRLGNAWLNYGPASVVEPAAQLASGMFSMPLSGVAGVTQAGLNAAGIDQTQPGDAVNEVQEKLTYQPRTAGGQAVSRVLQYPFEKLAQGAGKVGDLLNNPLLMIPTQYGNIRGGPGLATLADTGIQTAPALALRKGTPRAARAAVAEVPKPAPQISPRQALFDELNAKGLKVSPSQVEGATVGNLVEGMAGRAKSERGFSMKNAPRVNELVGEDVGLKGAKAITEADITRLKVEGNKPYNAIAKTGVRKTSNEYRQEIRSIGDRTGGASFAGDVPPDIVRLKKFYESRPQFTAQDAVNKIRQLRSEASKNIKAVNAPEQNAKGHVQRAIAEALDNELTRHAESLGKPELATNYKAARVQLAKIHTLEDALEGSHVSAKSLAQALDRGAPLSGNMELIARAYKEFDRSFQDFGKVRDSNPFSVLDAGAGVVGASASPPLLAAVLARPAARSILTSDRYQRSLVSGQEKPPVRTTGVESKKLVKPAVASQQKREAR